MGRDEYRSGTKAHRMTLALRNVWRWLGYPWLNGARRIRSYAVAFRAVHALCARPSRAEPSRAEPCCLLHVERAPAPAAARATWHGAWVGHLHGATRPRRVLQQWRRVGRSLLPCLAASFVFVVGAVVGLCLATIGCGCVNSVLWNCVVWYVPTPAVTRAPHSRSVRQRQCARALARTHTFHPRLHICA